MKNKVLPYKVVLCVISILSFIGSASAQQILLSQEEAERIGEKIFENECASKNEWLVRWNEGEDFLSLGIGHFIWYPEGRAGPFEESFPKFLIFAKDSGANIPVWLNTGSPAFCPWNSRDIFLRSQEDGRFRELEEFLSTTKPLQSSFIIKRFNDTLSLMLQNAGEKKRENINRQIERLVSTPKGAYALVDYSNFKGFGISPSEQYQGKSWGLLRVLSEMRDEKESQDAVKEFVETANRVLAERVNNAPKERNEERWLQGWQNRVNTYLKQ
jgi:hypothetical protein